LDEEADRVKGDETSVLLAGEFTVTPASAGTDSVATAEQTTRRLREIFIGQSPFSVEDRFF
jgi:hypothetical protein